MSGLVGGGEDTVALRRLAEAYAAAVDRRDREALLGLFLEDARLVVDRGGERSEYAGHEQLGRIFAPLERFDSTLHEVVGQRVELAGAEARCEVAGVAHHVARESDGASDFVMYLRYRDRCLRGEAGWRFAERRLEVLWTESCQVRLP